MNAHRAVALIPLAVAGCCLVRCSAGQEAAPYHPPALAPAAGTSDGPALYQRDCAWCHGNTGQGTTYGPSLLGGTNGPALTDLMLSTGRMPLTTTDQKDALHRRPAYDPGAIAALVEAVSSLGTTGTAIPPVNPATGTLAEGQQLFQADCAACHSVTGAGGTLPSGKAAVINGFTLARRGLVVPSVLQSSPLQVAEALRTGPPGMPVFGPDALTDQQMNAIVAYVGFLQQVPDRGGLGLGRIGPVAEGAVGWLLGLGALLGLVRWIGTGGRRGPGGQDGGA